MVKLMCHINITDTFHYSSAKLIRYQNKEKMQIVQLSPQKNNVLAQVMSLTDMSFQLGEQKT